MAAGGQLMQRLQGCGAAVVQAIQIWGAGKVRRHETEVLQHAMSQHIISKQAARLVPQSGEQRAA